MFKRFKTSTHPSTNGINEYLCTTIDDISKLPRFNIPGTQEGTDFDNEPTGYYSKAIVKNHGVFLLFPDNEWATL